MKGKVTDFKRVAIWTIVFTAWTCFNLCFSFRALLAQAERVGFQPLMASRSVYWISFGVVIIACTFLCSIRKFMLNSRKIDIYVYGMFAVVLIFNVGLFLLICFHKSPGLYQAVGMN